MNKEDYKTAYENVMVANKMLEQEIERLTKQNKALNEMYELTKKEYIRLNNIINELDKQNGELGANLSLIEDRINKTNWWLENMLKQATNMETKAIISGTLELLLGSDDND